MDTTEQTVWAIMAGGLLSLVMMAAADALMTRTLGALRNLLLLATISAACVMLSGLPETLFAGLSGRLGLALKAGFGLLSSALGLRFLGLWTGGVAEDRVIHRVTVWGCHGMLIATVVMVALATLLPLTESRHLLMLTAVLNALVVPLALVVAVRATRMGDPLARWLVLACVMLAGMQGGLYLQALDGAVWGMGLWVFTVACVLLFMSTVMVLITVRNRQQRRLARVARLDLGWDPATGLPTGAKLLGEVEHAFWRTGRLNGQCIVVCLYLSNLYEMGDTVGRSADNQILAATAARIRRAVGFRCVVGMYHPRCFIVVFSIDRKRHFDDAVVARLLVQVTQPLMLVGENDKRQPFTPQIGLALRTVLPDGAMPLEVIHEVEHEAMAQVRRPSFEDEVADTTW